MKTNILVLMMLLLGCGKIEQVQDSITGMISSNDLKLNDIRIGSLYRSNGTGGSFDYLEYENTQYRIGNVATDANSAYQQVPAGTLTPVYFKGSFARRSGISTGNPAQVFDVVDITGVSLK